MRTMEILNFLIRSVVLLLLSVLTLMGGVVVFVVIRELLTEDGTEENEGDEE